MFKTTFLGLVFIVAFALCTNPTLAQNFDSVEFSPSSEDGLLSDPNGPQDLPPIELADKVNAQTEADKVATEAAAALQRNRKTAAGRTVRQAVQEAMSWSPASYAYFITELNEQLEARNVLQSLGLHQRPHAAATKAQYRAELGLYGQRTLPASVLANVVPEAIRQGNLNDCWFLSTLAVVSNDHPYLIPSMIEVNTDGSYLVKFPGYPNKVLVKALPYNSTRAVGVKTTQYGEWPFVIECAATAVYPEEMRHGGKANVALKLLTGVDSNVYAFTANSHVPVISEGDLSETVVAALETNQSVMLASPKQGLLVGNHAYSVMDIMPANEQHGAMVMVRNPWGRLGFNPDNVDSNEIQTGEDGRFTLPVALLSKYFQDIVIPNNALRICPVSSANAPVPNNSNISSAHGTLPALPHSYISSGGRQWNAPLPGLPSSYIRNR